VAAALRSKPSGTATLEVYHYPNPISSIREQYRTREIEKSDFEGLLAGLGDALAYAKGADIRSLAHFVEIDRMFASAPFVGRAPLE